MHESHEHTWKLEELARHAGVSARTIRYYVQRGLLPAPIFRGRDTVYTSEHLFRLKAIRRLQERFLPLDAIQTTLKQCSPAALRQLACAQDDGGLTLGAAQHCMSQAHTALPQTSAAAPAAGEHWQRWVLAPGLELHVSDQASAETRRQAAALLSQFTGRSQAQGGV